MTERYENSAQSIPTWWARLDSNQRCILRHGFTDRCNRQLCILTHMTVPAGYGPAPETHGLRPGFLEWNKVHSDVEMRAGFEPAQ